MTKNSNVYREIDLKKARQKLKVAIESAGIEVGEQLVSGGAQDFRSEIWRLHPQFNELHVGSINNKIAKAMDRCGVAWYQHSVKIEDPKERRLAERAAATVGFDDDLSYEKNLNKIISG